MFNDGLHFVLGMIVLYAGRYHRVSFFGILGSGLWVGYWCVYFWGWAILWLVLSLVGLVV